MLAATLALEFETSAIPPFLIIEKACIGLPPNASPSDLVHAFIFISESVND